MGSTSERPLKNQALPVPENGTMDYLTKPPDHSEPSIDSSLRQISSLLLYDPGSTAKRTHYRRLPRASEIRQIRIPRSHLVSHHRNLRKR
jgi:hypothetical protein